MIIEEFNACLKRSRFYDKIKDATLISNARHHNIKGKIVMFVTLFWFSRKIKDYSSYELNYTEVLHSSVYGLYCDKTKLLLISWAEFLRPHDKLWITPVYASHKATSTHTSKNNIQQWEILPSSDKEITPLKSSLSLGYNLKKE